MRTSNLSAISALPATAAAFPSGETLLDDKCFQNYPKEPGGSPVHNYSQKNVQFYPILIILP